MTCLWLKTLIDFIYFYKPLCWNTNLDSRYNRWSLPVHLKLLHKNFLLFFIKYTNEQKERKFWRQKIKKSDFYKNKKVTKIDDIDVNKILVSKEEPYGTKNPFKYFIGYNDNDVIRPLCIKLPQMTNYVKKFEGNTTMSFKISNKQILTNF